MRWTHIAIFAALVAASVPHIRPARCTVEAGTAVRLGLADLAQRADLAFEGHVVSKTARVGDEGRIETEYQIRTERMLIGEPCALQTVRLPGGVLPDGRGLVLPGMPKIDVNEDIVLFLTSVDRRGTRMPIGLAQGKLRVTSNAQGVKQLVCEAGGLDLLSPNGEVRPADLKSIIDYTSAMNVIQSAIAARAAAHREVRR